MPLIIVESAAKGKKIKEYLGAGYDVQASLGHVNDLPLRELGVEPPTFKPTYELSERGASIVSRLKELVKRHKGDVYLATDLDREGEAIAYQLSKLLKLQVIKRITFSEITKTAIIKALQAPRQINMDLVSGQECRRVLDRFVGYLPNPALSSKFGNGNSAGRVQSIGLRLVYEREIARKNFKPVEHYNVFAQFTKDGISFSGEWIHPFKKYAKESDKEADHVDQNHAKYLTNLPAAEKMVAAVNGAPYFTVVNYGTKEVSESAPPPYTTSQLQQEAGKKLGWSSEKTMKVAQALYESGFITYHRTDSKELSDEAIAQIRQFLSAFQQAKNITGYLPAEPNKFKNSENSQEAHEAVRPSNIMENGSSLTDPEQQQLYAMIRTRTIASQLAPARYLVTQMQLNHDATGQEFAVRGRQIKFDGWRCFIREDDEDNETNSASAKLPRLDDMDTLKSDDAFVKKSVTKAPPAMTEPEMIKILERKGIGRPSTYATICQTNLKRGYIEREKKGGLSITSVGVAVCEWLIKSFSFLEYNYSAQMEKGIDDVISKKRTYVDFVAGVYHTVTDEVKKVAQNDPSIKTDERGNVARPSYPVISCPTCGNETLTRFPSKYAGKFYWACKRRCGQDMLGDLNGVPVPMKEKTA